MKYDCITRSNNAPEAHHPNLRTSRLSLPTTICVCRLSAAHALVGVYGLLCLTCGCGQHWIGDLPALRLRYAVLCLLHPAGSLFGGSSTPAFGTTGGSLFGSTPTSTPATGTSLFGGSTFGAAPATGGLFGAAPAAGSAPAGSAFGGFGAAPAAAAAPVQPASVGQQPYGALQPLPQVNVPENKVRRSASNVDWSVLLVVQ